MFPRILPTTAMFTIFESSKNININKFKIIGVQAEGAFIATNVYIATLKKSLEYEK